MIGIVVVIGLWLGINYVTSFKSVKRGEVCFTQEGGPLDGRDLIKVREPGSSRASIGLFNNQHCFPATQRNYIVSPDPRESDSKAVDFVEVPTLDAVNVRVDGQALFEFNPDPALVRQFAIRYGLRTFNGKHPYDGDEGWRELLAVQFRPVLDNALREAIGKFRCVELNNTCQYVVNAEDAVKGRTEEVDNSQDLQAAQAAIESTLARDLNDTLGGEYFINVKFRLRRVTFNQRVQEQIVLAQTKRTEVATAKLEAQRRAEIAAGDTQVAREQALQIRLKAESYERSPAQADIDKIRALCGEAGCQGLQVLGGDSGVIANLK